MSIYDLFSIDPSASPHEILSKCKSYCQQWTIHTVLERLTENLGALEAGNNVQKVYSEGEMYIKSAAAILLDPSARQCYDAWLDAISQGTPEKKKLTRSRLLWFNDTSDNICFSESMINALGDVGYQTKKVIPKRTMDIRPECRECRMPFDISKDYLVLHCHCTTRVGHEGCLNDFDKRVKHKCPVCRQPTLKRRRISKYLFWNVKEKYKFIA